MNHYKYNSLRGKSKSGVEIWAKFFVLLSIVSWGITPVIGIKNVVTILALAGFVLTMTGIRKPSVGLIGISVLCTLDPLTRDFVLTGGILRWNSLNYWLLLVMVFYSSLLVRLDNLQTRLLTLFLMVMGISLLVTQNFENGLQNIMAIMITFGILVYFVRAMNDPDALYWSAVVCGWLAGLGGLVYFGLPGMSHLMNPNVWSFFPLTAIISSSCLAVHVVSEQKRRLFTLYVLTAINMGWVFLSSSRGGFIISLMVILILLIAGKNVRLRALLLILGIVALVVISNQFDNLQQHTIARITKTFDSNYSILDRTSGRSDLIYAGWQIFLKNPMGVGTGGFAPAWLELGSLGGSLTFILTGKELSAHSGWIKVLAENGIPGILLFGGYVLSFAITAWRKKDCPIVGLQATSCLTVALITTEFQSKGLWYLAAGAIVLINRQSISKKLVDWEQGYTRLGRSIGFG